SRQPHAIAIDLFLQTRVVAAMKVIHQRRRFVHQLVALCHRLKECRAIFTTLRWTAGPKSGIKSADTVQECRCKGHTRTTTKISSCVRIERGLRMVLCHIEDLPGESSTRSINLLQPASSELLLKPELRRGLKFHRQDEPSDTCYI